MADAKHSVGTVKESLTVEVIEQLRNIAEKSDTALSKRFGYQMDRICEDFRTLINKGRVEVGYRSACGKTDPTMFIYREWQKLLKAAQRAGLNVSAEPVKHGNAYATSKGGFWSSAIYSLPADDQKEGE